jgi:ATP-dependent DNA helicase DinG
VGQVVVLDQARTGKAVDTSFIDEAYASLEKLPDFSQRKGQKALSLKIHEALVNGKPFAAEAPTGTGKTIAYLIAALAAQKNRPESNLPVVIATATVGLQEQILTGDLPKLVKAGVLGHNEAVIAKGRGRYFCVLSAERIMHQAAKEGQFDFFDSKANDATATLNIAQDMLDQFEREVWSGDYDQYLGSAVPSADVWGRLAASSDTCISKRCPHFDACPFFKDRSRMMKAKVIIANHDLVMSDLKMAKTAEQDPLFGEKYLLVFDEAHNLPDKALNAGSAELELEAAQLSVSQLPSFSGRLFKEADIATLLRHKDIAPSDLEPGPALKALADAAAAVRKMPHEEPESSVVKLGHHPLPATLERALIIASEQVSALQSRFVKTIMTLRNSKLPETKPHLASYFAEALFQGSYIGTRLKEITTAFEMFLSPVEGRSVRWLDHTAMKAKLYSSPLEGADFLRTHLWQSERVIPVLISATLRTFGNFDRFRTRSGLPAYAGTHTVDPIFRYQDSTLVVATKMKHSPRHAERAEWEQEVSEILPNFIRRKDATLVLFPSKKLMLKALPALRARFPSAVLAQKELPFSRLIQLHKETVDAGKTSILCGLATLAEGLDLPGNYCTHVIIVALPFSVPTSPVEQELQDSMGPLYFKQRALPDALMKLIQMAGRLIRRENDKGRITILDKRLWLAFWGGKMLKSLPNYKKREEIPEDRGLKSYPSENHHSALKDSSRS